MSFESVTTRRNLVGGEGLVPRDASLLDGHSPHTGAAIGHVPMTPAEGVAQAVEAAWVAAYGWRATPPHERTLGPLPVRGLNTTTARRSRRGFLRQEKERRL